MKFHDYTKIDLNADAFARGTEGAWRKAARAESNGTQAIADWPTLEQIPVKAVYTPADLAPTEHLDFTAGIAPFLRGPYATMYVLKP